MAECLVISMVATAPPAPAAEAAVDGDGLSPGFTLEEIVPGDGEDAPEENAIAPETVPADPLQMLIEDMSGISGALRSAPQPQTDRGEAEGAAPVDTTPRIAVPVTVDAAPPQGPAGPEVALDAVLADPPPADAPDTGIESLLIDAPSQSSGLRAETALPTEIRAPRIALPVPVARQLAEAVVTTRDELVEIALAPEELGRIRMVMSGPEHSPHVMIWVERPEVLDQLRRNAAFLQECFGDAGMAEASFAFAGDTPSDSRKDNAAAMPADRAAFEIAEDSRSVPIAWTPMALRGRLDIRI